MIEEARVLQRDPVLLRARGSLLRYCDRQAGEDFLAVRQLDLLQVLIARALGIPIPHGIPKGQPRFIPRRAQAAIDEHRT